VRPVFFVLCEDFLLFDLAAAAEPFRLANAHLSTPRFRLTFIAAQSMTTSSVGLFLGAADALPASLPDDALVVLLGFRASTRRGRSSQHAALSQWLATVIRPSHWVLCICTGAFLAAQAGLLDGRACTTHHDFCAQLAREYPRAQVRENRIFVRDGNLFTSAGITAGVDLTLFVLSLLVGEAVSLKVARELVVYMRRTGDDPQLSPLLAHRNHLHPVVHRVQDAVAQQPTRDWTLESLARVAHLSPRQLTRLFPNCTGITPVGYVTHIRLAKARELLADSELDLERIAENAGFGSLRQFRRLFRRAFGTSPSHWRQRVWMLRRPPTDERSSL
jgi:transcriptional regulator GlxA family with amidase domain